ncbi:hypothetical protein [Streptomyces spiralis]|nr:hypothetical protein [Streptomyces spiralis]
MHAAHRRTHPRTHRRGGPSGRPTSALPAERGAEALEALEAPEVDDGSTA